MTEAPKPTHFSRITLAAWQQFAKVEIDFHPRLTILTGANGSGKTTLLRLLAQHKGWPTQLLATPAKNRKTGAIEFIRRLFGGVDKSSDAQVGSIVYADTSEAILKISSGFPSIGGGEASYSIQIEAMKPVSCMFMPSHRQVYRYSPLQNIPAARKTEQTAFEEVYSLAMQQQQGGMGQSASFFMKSTLVGWAIQGYGVVSDSRTVMAADNAQKDAYEGFQRTLKKMLPSSLGFEEIELRKMEVVFVCNGGRDEFLLETASGGVATLIDLAWQLFMFSRAYPGDFTVLIDEAENHLHPTLQRELLPKLLVAFPNARFVVSTHSALVVSSVRDANVYVLRYDETRKVVSQKLDLQEKARSALEILDEVLGVSTTLPVWVEDELRQAVGEAVSAGLSERTFEILRARLKSAGLEHLMPEAIQQTAER